MIKFVKRSPQQCAANILAYPFRRIEMIAEESRPCSMCGKLGTVVEILLSEDEDVENPHAMAHFGPACWRKVKPLIALKEARP